MNKEQREERLATYIKFYIAGSMRMGTVRRIVKNDAVNELDIAAYAILIKIDNKVKYAVRKARKENRELAMRNVRKHFADYVLKD
jgi:hypothetical protein